MISKAAAAQPSPSRRIPKTENPCKNVGPARGCRQDGEIRDGKLCGLGFGLGVGEVLKLEPAIQSVRHRHRHPHTFTSAHLSASPNPVSETCPKLMSIDVVGFSGLPHAPHRHQACGKTGSKADAAREEARWCVLIPGNEWGHGILLDHDHRSGSWDQQEIPRSHTPHAGALSRPRCNL